MPDAKKILEAFRLDGKVVVVTGASRGIGKAIALAMAAAGADLALVGREEPTLAPVAREIEDELGRRAAVVPLDIARVEEHAAAVSRIEERLGPVDILVNNAGINVRGEAARYAPEDWDRITDVNLRGTFFF